VNGHSKDASGATGSRHHVDHPCRRPKQVDGQEWKLTAKWADETYKELKESMQYYKAIR